MLGSEGSSVAVEHAEHHIEDERDDEGLPRGAVVCPEAQQWGGHQLAHTEGRHHPTQELSAHMHIHLHRQGCGQQLNPAA